MTDRHEQPGSMEPEGRVGRRRFLSAAAGLLAACCAAPAAAQQPPVHYRHSANSPPGTVGRHQLTRGGPIGGYFQPVQILGPKGLAVSFAEGGAFPEPEAAPAKAGLLIGKVYRLRVTRIPKNAGQEVYPTIEVIDRLYPPPGLKARHPIPIELTRHELELALEGKLVTRVIYVEHPRTAFPRKQLPVPDSQRWFEVSTAEDPLQVADELGRPVAILRMGSRIPGPQGPDARFLYGSPPLERYPEEIAGPPAAEPGPADAPPALPGQDEARRRAPRLNFMR